MLAGINDIRVGTSAAATYADLLVLYGAILAQGSHLYPVTLFPFGNFSGWSAPKQVQLEALNTMIRNYCAAADPSRVTCIDAYNSNLRDGVNLAAIYDSGDGLHQNSAGSDYFSTLVRAVMP